MLFLPLPTYRCLLSSNGNGGSNIYIPLPTYLCLLSSNGDGGSNIYLPLPTYLCLPTYVVALRIKQAEIGRLPFWTLFAFFTDRGAGEKSANMKKPGQEPIRVDPHAKFQDHGMAE